MSSTQKRGGGRQTDTDRLDSCSSAREREFAARVGRDVQDCPTALCIGRPGRVTTADGGWSVTVTAVQRQSPPKDVLTVGESHSLLSLLFVSSYCYVALSQQAAVLIVVVALQRTGTLFVYPLCLYTHTYSGLPRAVLQHKHQPAPRPSERCSSRQAVHGPGPPPCTILWLRV